MPPTPAWLLAALALCLLVGVTRVLLLFEHQPLIALANSYDEVRYTACFDLYPDRPADVPPTRNSPEAPFAHYRFVPGASPICYWSSELAFQAATAAIYSMQETIGAAREHSVRWIGALKLAALLGVWLGLSWALLRRGEHALALAHGLLLPLLFADPANAIYLNTFYAEWTALLAAYALCGLIVLGFAQAPTRVLRVLFVLSAFVLATSKIQHLLLPLACAGVVLLLEYLRTRSWAWQGKAVLLGAVAGLALQCVQLARDSDAIHAIDMFNRSDVAFMGLLPNARDPAATAAKLGLDPACLKFVGMRGWEMSDWPGHACPSLSNLTRGRELMVLIGEPDLTLRLGWNGVLALEPWLAPGLGMVEGGNFDSLPPGFPSFSAVLSASPWLRVLALAAPLISVPLLLAGWRRRAPRLLIFTTLIATIMLASLTVTLLGDGLADTPKQGHLVLNAALAWWICILALGAARIAGRVRRG